MLLCSFVLSHRAPSSLFLLTMASLARLGWTLAVAAPAVHALYINGSVIAPCDSPIYCHGDILEQVELARPFSDSKTFVDM
jgi:alpha,alpha-trehalase